MKTLLAVLGALTALSSATFGQSLGFYSDLQYDSASGDAYTYAETWSDYSSQYYYDLYVYSQLNVSYDGGPTNITCQRSAYGYNGNTAVSCSINVGTGTVDMELISVHENTATYYVYQFDYSCNYDCYYWWDAFQTSLIGAQGGTYETSQAFYPQGPPAQRVPQSKTAYAQLVKRRTNRACKFPTGEDSLYMLWSNWYPYAAHFAGQLQGPDNYTNRVVGETLQQLQGDTCWYPGSPHQPLYINYNPGGWIVGVQQSGDIGVFSTLYNTFGMDTVGYSNTSAYYHYRTRMQQSGLQCGLTFTQQMRIDSCGGQYSHDYGIQHGLLMYINSSGATVTRKNATAGPKY